MQVLRQYHSNYACTKNYTVNYMAGNTERSVKPEFFLQGNNVMLQRYNGKLPWKESEMLTIEF